ncbi:AMP-binding protein [Mycobacterium koreense]|uniref:Acyl-CoA synthetase n=1 Tax=Mycolicibacillus koreensis TaxID=1069220 RepID=A0A7I7SEK3_9MYCO|nr:AMP-binding protein [Mycolicibacillus koreensis]MCV7247988.1 AMP-binding protein [Mycolicibacillus koreensis]OSC33179.1 acyl-CoA synthetase [Mycolicibacillus koreensis]BBY54405.1 long-chain-fatty-acid--AMP ligase FadD26 [Mycolicibacillus koreensis]
MTLTTETTETIESSIPAVLARRAHECPDQPAFTYIDYDVNPDGFTETLTWADLFNRANVVAAELSAHGSPGDRVAIVAPQGLEYIVGLLGAMAAGFIAVPLSVPMFGVHDERVTGALADSAPVSVLTTSAAVDAVMACVKVVRQVNPQIIEVDALDFTATPAPLPESAVCTTALLQYTSGSTRSPAGVVVTHRNIITNLQQMMSDQYGRDGGVPPADTTVVTWLPFYHDLGLQFGIFYPILAGLQAVTTSPMAFLQKPARWMQLLATHPNAFSGAPNFAFELAVSRTSEEDMAGLDLSGVLSIASGAERVQPATLRRFIDRFSALNLPATALRPGYGLAEANVYLTSLDTASAPVTARFDYEKLAAGYAQRSEADASVEMVSNGAPRACTVRIVDPETRTENPAGKVGEIWAHGDNIAEGYWRNPEATQRTFGADLVDPSPGTPQGSWLRTGDLGVLCDGELYVTGRIKDLLIVDGRNHYPDDIEATVQEISHGRAAAITVGDDGSEQLAVIVEMRRKGASEEEARNRLLKAKREITAAISRYHGVRAADLVLVDAGSIPITTSGKIRRSACADLYRSQGFHRLDDTDSAGPTE